MSYLLDALRKAERERHPERVADLAQWHDPVGDGRGGGLPGWVAPVVAALVLLNAAILAALWLSRQSAPPDVGPETIDAAAPAPAARPSPPEAPARVPETPPQPAFAAAAAPTAADGYDEPVDSVAAQPADPRRQLPPIGISGHLYSSIPGRSFLLVDGRRYREGERLPQGPAIESIDEAGAVLDYRGERFRVAAPR